MEMVLPAGYRLNHIADGGDKSGVEGEGATAGLVVLGPPSRRYLGDDRYTAVVACGVWV